MSIYGAEEVCPLRTTVADVREFLALRRIALVGVSRQPKDFSRMLFREMCKRGYDMVPVNPTVGELESRRCFRRVQEIDPPAEGALVMTAPRNTERVKLVFASSGCIAAAGRALSVKRLQISVTSTVSTWLRAIAVHVFSQTSFIHRVHGLITKLLGGYPAAR